ncbi:MAG: hypothetical protein NTX82_06265 [Candidatus Parcubacteria bacterium]|nr:hypothetical protein [Candidatus Parcubacteria bacterium]
MRKFFAAMVLILVGLMVQACEQPKQDVKIVYQQPGTKGGGTVDDLNWQDIYRQSIMSVPKIEIWQCRVVANDCF